MFARNREWSRNKDGDKALLTHCRKSSQIVSLSSANLLLLPESPLRTEANLRKFWQALRQMEERPEAARILREAPAFRSAVENQWTVNRKQVANELGRMLRIRIPRYQVNVLTTHPEIPTGYAVPQLHAICWGHREEFKTYHSVYLAHELLHFVLQFDDREISHAMVELIADDELRLRLNKTGRYFQYPGHARLLPIKKKLLPHWQRYLSRKRGTIVTFLRECQRFI